MPGWYAVHTKPREEDRAQEHLARQGYDCFLPRIRERRRRRDRRIEVVQALFPRYLFIQLELGGQSVAAIRSTRGVIGLVRFGEQMPSVPDELIQDLWAHAEPDTWVVCLDDSEPQIGDTVEVDDGPFAGLRGILQERTSEERVIVLLDILGKQSRVSVSRHALSRAS